MKKCPAMLAQRQDGLNERGAAMRNNTKKTTPEPLRAKWLARNKTIIIITEASDERIQELLRLFDDGHRLPGS